MQRHFVATSLALLAALIFLSPAIRAVLIALKCQKELQDTVRQILVSRRRLGGRLIGIKEMYEKDYQRYWTVYVVVPLDCMS